MLIAPKCVLWLYSEDPDEMLHYAVFHQGLIYTICKNRNNLQRKKCNKNNIIHCRDNVGMDQLKPFCEKKVNV